MEQRVATPAKALEEVFGAKPHSRIALETGMHSPWVSRLLSELGYEVIVVHARNVRLIGESRKKDDRLDASTLARLARIDPQLVCPVKHRSAKAQADLTMIRARAGLVQTRTALVNTARGLAKSYGERLRGCNVLLTLEDPYRFRKSGDVGCYLGLPARKTKLRAKRAADAHQQGKRPVPANPAGAGSAAQLGTIWRGLRSAPLGPEAGRARRKEWEKASDHRHGAKAGVLMHHLWVSGEEYEPLHDSRRAIAAAAA